MGYFPNGTSFAVWQEQQCSECLNYRDNGTGSFGCAITDAHFLLDYHEGTNATVLDELIPDKGQDAFICRMRLTHQMIEDGKAAEKQDRDRQRYEAAIAEMHEQQAVA